VGWIFATEPIEQLHLQRPLEFLHVSADGGLRQVQIPRRLREAPLRVDATKNLKQAQIHGADCIGCGGCGAVGFY
jgi:hypothetical protein